MSRTDLYDLLGSTQIMKYDFENEDDFENRLYSQSPYSQSPYSLTLLALLEATFHFIISCTGKTMW